MTGTYWPSSITNDDGTCADWSGYSQMDLVYNLTVKSGDVVYSTVDADTPFELYMKWKFGSSDQFGLLWNIALTCNAVIVPTGYVHAR